jgi:hypothetical protein
MPPGRRALGEVDDGVAAEDEVVGASRRAQAQQVAQLEGDQRAQLGDRLPARAVVLEEARQGRGRGVAHVVGAEVPGAGALDRAAIDVGPEDRRPRVGGREAAHRGQRVGLRSVGAAGAPGAQRAVGGERRHDLALQELPLLGVAPQVGHVDRDAIEEVLAGAAVADQELEVGRQGRVAAALGEGAYAPLHLTALVLQQIDVAQAAHPLAEGHVIVDDSAPLLDDGGRPSDEVSARGHQAPASAAMASARSPSGRTRSAKPSSTTARGIP